MVFVSYKTVHFHAYKNRNSTSHDWKYPLPTPLNYLVRASELHMVQLLPYLKASTAIVRFLHVDSWWTRRRSTAYANFVLV